MGRTERGVEAYDDALDSVFDQTWDLVKSNKATVERHDEPDFTVFDDSGNELSKVDTEEEARDALVSYGYYAVDEHGNTYEWNVAGTGIIKQVEEVDFT